MPEEEMPGSDDLAIDFEAVAQGMQDAYPSESHAFTAAEVEEVYRQMNSPRTINSRISKIEERLRIIRNMPKPYTLE